MRKSMRKILAFVSSAAIMATMITVPVMTANAAVDKIFDYNIAHEVVSTISEKLRDWGIIATADDTNASIFFILFLIIFPPFKNKNMSIYIVTYF